MFNDYCESKLIMVTEDEDELLAALIDEVADCLRLQDQLASSELEVAQHFSIRDLVGNTPTLTATTSKRKPKSANKKRTKEVSK